MRAVRALALLLFPAAAGCSLVAGLGQFEARSEPTETDDDSDASPKDSSRNDVDDPSPTDSGEKDAAAPDTNPPIPADLVAWLPFDEGQGSTSADKTGHGHSATLVGATWVTGRSGSAVYVRQTGATPKYLSLSTLVGTSFPQAKGTVGFWYKPDPGLSAGTWPSARWVHGRSDRRFEGLQSLDDLSRASRPPLI